MKLHPSNQPENGLLAAPVRRWLARRLARTSRDAPTDWIDAGLFKLDRVGDFVLALGALRLLLRHYGEDRCVLFVSEQTAELAAAEFPRTPRHVLSGASGSVLRDWLPLRLRHQEFFARTGCRTLVNLRHWPSPHNRLVLSWIKRTQTVSLAPLPESGEDPFDPVGTDLPPLYPAAADAPWCRELLAHRSIVQTVLGRPVGFEELRPRFQSVAHRRGDYLLVCPFSHSPLRDYPSEGIAAVLRSLSAEGQGPPVLLSGTSTQGPALLRLAQAADLPASAVRAGGSLMDLVRLVGSARAVLALDSAPAHIATALDQPAVVLLGGGHYGLFCPWGGEGRRQWLTHPLPCYGCNWHCIHPAAFCLTQIAPARIVHALRVALAAD